MCPQFSRERRFRLCRDAKPVSIGAARFSLRITLDGVFAPYAKHQPCVCTFAPMTWPELSPIKNGCTPNSAWRVAGAILINS